MQLTKEVMEEYAYFFKSMRESIGYTLTQMADKMGVHKNTLGKWESGIKVGISDIYAIEYKVREIVKDHRRMVRNAS